MLNILKSNFSIDIKVKKIHFYTLLYVVQGLNLVVCSSIILFQGYMLLDKKCQYNLIPTVVNIMQDLQTFYILEGVVVVIVWQLDLQVPVQLLLITTKIVSSNPVHDEMYSIQHYVIQFVSDLRQVGCFLGVPRFHPPIKLTITYN